MAIVLSGTTNDITVNGVSVATDAEVNSAVAHKANTSDVNTQLALKANTADLKEIGVGQTWQDVTASRVFGTNYTNSTGKPIVVILHSVSFAGTGGMLLEPIVDGVTLPYTSSYYNGPGFSSTCSFIVPNGVTYSVLVSNAGNPKWSELR